MPTIPPAVALDDVCHTYRSPAGRVEALRNVTHTFAPGTFTAVMGPSGSGKSTLLQLAAGLEAPTAGQVTVAGTPLAGLNRARAARLRRTTVGFVFQAYNLLDALSAYDNVALPARLAGQPVERAAVLDALGRVGLRDVARRRPPELSGGQQQRVAVARALYSRPAVVFADEPTGALDRAAGRQVLDLLRQLVDQEQRTVVMVTHDPTAASTADGVLFLADGRIAGHTARRDAASIAADMSELECSA
jgi:putative ABC transport system ATP-binding protein